MKVFGKVHSGATHLTNFLFVWGIKVVFPINVIVTQEFIIK